LAAPYVFAKISITQQEMKDNQMSNYTHFVGKVVQFTPEADILEDYPEAGMRGVITKINVNHDRGYDRDTVLIVEVDHTDFDEFNKPFESSNYYNGKQVPCLTAREAGLYSAKTRYYMSPFHLPTGPEAMMTLVDSASAKLHDEFQKSGRTKVLAVG
jgi:hypothetical protein